MIGVAIAFLAPWVVVGGLLVGGFVWLRRHRKK